MELADARIDIRSLNLDELTEEIKKLGEKAFRAKQVYQWLWEKSVVDFSEMTNLSISFREQLEQHFSLLPIFVDSYQKSNDGTIKSGFRLHDGHLIEGVLIPVQDDGRFTACVSSQVGCSLSCSFCATGKMERMRNLSPAEIYDQVAIINAQAMEHFGKPISNIVFMGMGEPLLNYKNVLAGIERITAENGLGMSPKRITVSTAGVAKMIDKLTDDSVKFNLALSLHHTTDEGRSKIMPINDSNSIDNLIQSLKRFKETTGNRVTFEYILFDTLNETPDDAKRLASLAKACGAKVNIIEYNPIEGVSFKKSAKQQRENFIEFLEKERVTATVRKSRGKDIDAACGQLANKGN